MIVCFDFFFRIKILVVDVPTDWIETLRRQLQQLGRVTRMVVGMQRTEIVIREQQQFEKLTRPFVLQRNVVSAYGAIGVQPNRVVADDPAPSADPRAVSAEQQLVRVARKLLQMRVQHQSAEPVQQSPVRPAQAGERAAIGEVVSDRQLPARQVLGENIAVLAAPENNTRRLQQLLDNPRQLLAVLDGNRGDRVFGQQAAQVAAQHRQTQAFVRAESALELAAKHTEAVELAGAKSAGFGAQPAGPRGSVRADTP